MRPIRRLLSTAFRQQKPCKADHCLGGIAAGPKIVRTCRFQSRQATKPKRFRRSILRRKVARTPAHWRRVAFIVAGMTGKRVGVDTATRMAKDADRQG